MKIKIENLKNSQKLIKVEVESEKVNSVLDDVYHEIGKTARIPGFRTGRAPRDLLETHHGERANQEALQRLIWDYYRKAVVAQEIDAVGYPVIDEVKFDKGEPLTFTAKVDVRPEFKLKNYKGIKIKKEKLEVTEDDISNALKNIQESLAQYRDIGPRALAEGDYIVCEYECFSDGKTIDKNDKLWLYINDQLQPKELFSALVGAAIGTTKEVEVTHPEDYQNKELAGKKALYKVTPKQIKEKAIPEIDDALAKKAGPFKGLDALKEHLREHVLRTKEERLRRSQENQAFDYLLKNHPFEVPDSVVDRQLNHLVENAKLRLLYQGYKREDLDKDDEQFKKTLYDTAMRNVRVFFILDEIAKSEKVEVLDAELDERIGALAKETKETAEELKKRLTENSQMENLKEQMMHEKAIELLLKEAKEV